MKILICEDETLLAESLSDARARQGYTVDIAPDGELAWELYTEDPKKYDVILSDINMPKLDGFSLIRRIRARDQDKPVIIMTGRNELEFPIQAIKLGVNDFLQKPFPVKKLKSILSNLEELCSFQVQLFKLLPELHQENTLTIPAKQQFISGLIHHLKRHYSTWCDFHKTSPNTIDLCIREALINAVVHGSLEISSALKQKSWKKFEKKIQLRESMEPYSQRKIKVRVFQMPDSFVVEVEDEGPGFLWRNLHMASNEQNHGRGLLLIRTIMDEVSWNEKGNLIRMVKRMG